MAYHHLPDMVPKEEFDRRNKICDECEHKQPDPTNMRREMCEVCSCFIFAKTQLKVNECPVGKWKSWSS